MPPGLGRWSWGVFLLNWIWGLGNSTYVALLALVPFVNLVMIFVLGLKGNEWAWRNHSWTDVGQFRRVQSNWAIAGFVVWLAIVPLVLGGIAGVMTLMKSTPPYEMSSALVRDHAETMAVLGRPMVRGFWVTGQVSTSGPNGNAERWFAP